MIRIQAIIWLAYFVLPSEGGIVDGVPLGPAETVGVLMVAWIAAHRVRLRGGGIAAVAMLAGIERPKQRHVIRQPVRISIQ